MQYHESGFRPGDPSVARAAEMAGQTPDIVDVLIVGCGPAGLTLATQLCPFSDISVRIVDQKPGPLEVGQADGIACRSIEMFEAFGFAEKVIKEGYQVNEVTFWRPDADRPLARVDRIEDVAEDLSEMPHVILSQARIHDFYLEQMRNSPRRLTPDYNRRLIDLVRPDDPDAPITATFEHVDAPEIQETIRARFVVGCDGARSGVRRALGHRLEGDSARQLWGVMDILPRTDFPDIRLKCAIQSADAGSILVIPREGGYMVRLYIELDALAEGERAADRDVTAEDIIAKARRILAPYTLEVAEVAWWSAYEIGQRVCDAFDDVPEAARGSRVPRIFIAGDACHTHSPKAGQGMNVSMADAFNLGWKLACVLRGQAVPHLLDTYGQERQATARELIDFDRDMARLFSAKPRTDAEKAQFQHYFQRHGRYTAGVETCYAPSLITATPRAPNLATGFAAGTRFHSAPVIRLADAKPLHLGHVLKADGRWRVMLFAPRGDKGAEGGPLAQICAGLGQGNGLIARYTPQGADIDSVLDIRTILQSPHREVDLTKLPALLLPQKGPMALTDYEKVFCPSLDGPDIFDLRGVDRDRGVAVLLRPDQYVAEVAAFDEIWRIDALLGAVLRPARP